MDCNTLPIEYAPVVKLAYTLDFDCVTTVHLFPASSGRLKSGAKLNMRVWRNWQTHEI